MSEIIPACFLVARKVSDSELELSLVTSGDLNMDVDDASFLVCLCDDAV